MKNELWDSRMFSRMADGHDGCDGPDGGDGVDGFDGGDGWLRWRRWNGRNKEVLTWKSLCVTQ